MTSCSVDGCDRPSFCKGWCSAHYYRQYRHGEVFPDQPFRPGRQVTDCACRACEVNPWFHRAPRCPRGHGPDFVLLLTTRDGVELWNCIEPGCSGQSFVAEVAEQEDAA